MKFKKLLVGLISSALLIATLTITVLAATSPVSQTVTLGNGAVITGRLTWDSSSAFASTSLGPVPTTVGCSASASISATYYPSGSETELKTTGNGCGGQFGCTTPSISNESGRWVSITSTHTGRCDGQSATFHLNN